MFANVTCNRVPSHMRVAAMISAALILALAASLTGSGLEEASAMKAATWVHSRTIMPAPRLAVRSLVYYNLLSPSDCAMAATTARPCFGFDASTGAFSYTAPKSYGVAGACSYPCESQDVLVNYPATYTYNGMVYLFSNAQQDQCSPGFGCSTETTWASPGPILVPYSGTPVGLPVEIDTQVFYSDLTGSSSLEIEFTYNLENGYDYG